MKYYITGIVVLLIGFYLLFQYKSIPKKWQNYTEQIENDFKGYQILEDLCYKVGGRLAGTPQGKKAEQFVINQLKSFGYDSIYTQEFEHLAWERSSCSLVIKDSRRNSIKKIKALSLGMTPSKSDLELEIVYVGSGIPKEYEKYSDEFLKNRIALIDMSSPMGSKISHRVDKMEIAQKMGVQGVIFYNYYYGNVITIGAVSFNDTTTIPAIAISREDADFILDLMQEKKSIYAEIDVKNHLYNSSARNIWVELKGNELADEIVFICAHLDAWDLSQGAMDNGADVALLLELARQFKKQQLNQKRTICFMFFNAEELGTIGSRIFVQTQEEYLSRIFYLINLEMNLTPNGINLLLDDRDRTWFEDLTSGMKSLGFQKRVETEIWLQSDHAYFMAAGIPSLVFTENQDIFIGQKYHSAQDSIDQIPEEDLKNCAKSIGIVLWELSNTTEIQKWRLSKEEVNTKLNELGIMEIMDLRKM